MNEVQLRFHYFHDFISFHLCVIKPNMSKRHSLAPKDENVIKRIGLPSKLKPEQEKIIKLQLQLSDVTSKL